MIQGKRVIRELLASYRDCILQQKTIIQIQRLKQMLAASRQSQFLDALKTHKEESLNQRSEKLANVLIATRVGIVFQYMAAHRMAWRYYDERVFGFHLRRQGRLLNQTWNGFKQVIMTEIINDNIVRQYLQYARLSRLAVIFEGIKSFSFAQKLLHRREATLKKLRLSSYFEVLTFNMRIALFGRYKHQRVELDRKKEQLEHYLSQRKASFVKSALRRQLIKKKVLCRVRK